MTYVVSIAKPNQLACHGCPSLIQPDMMIWMDFGTMKYAQANDNDPDGLAEWSFRGETRLDDDGCGMEVILAATLSRAGGRPKTIQMW